MSRLTPENVTAYEAAMTRLKEFHTRYAGNDFVRARFQSDNERSQFAPRLKELLDGLDQDAATINDVFHTPIQVAFLSTFSAGKSSVLNGLIAALDPSLPPPREAAMTKLDVYVTILTYGAPSPPRPRKPGDDFVRVQMIPLEILREINLIDTPGLGAEVELDVKVCQILKNCDFIFYLLHPTNALNINDKQLLKTKFEQIPDVEMRFMAAKAKEFFKGRVNCDPGDWPELIRNSKEIDQWLATNATEYHNQLRVPAQAYDLFSREMFFFVETDWGCGIPELQAFILGTIKTERENLKNARLMNFRQRFREKKIEYLDLWRHCADRTRTLVGRLQTLWQKAREEAARRIDELKDALYQRITQHIQDQIEGAALLRHLELTLLLTGLRERLGSPDSGHIPPSITTLAVGGMDRLCRRILALERWADRALSADKAADDFRAAVEDGLSRFTNAAGLARFTPEDLRTVLDSPAGPFYTALEQLLRATLRLDRYEAPDQAVEAYETEIQELVRALAPDLEASGFVTDQELRRRLSSYQDHFGQTFDHLVGEFLNKTVAVGIQQQRGTIELKLCAEEVRRIDQQGWEVVELWRKSCNVAVAPPYRPLDNPDDFARSALARLASTDPAATALPSPVVTAIQGVRADVETRVADMILRCSDTATELNFRRRLAETVRRDLERCLREAAARKRQEGEAVQGALAGVRLRVSGVLRGLAAKHGELTRRLHQENKKWAKTDAKLWYRRLGAYAVLILLAVLAPPIAIYWQNPTVQWMATWLGGSGILGAVLWMCHTLWQVRGKRHDHEVEVNSLCADATQAVREACDKLRQELAEELRSFESVVARSGEQLDRSAPLLVQDSLEALRVHVQDLYLLQADRFGRLLADFEEAIKAATTRGANAIRDGFARFNATAGSTVDDPVRGRLAEVDNALTEWLTSKELLVRTLQQDHQTLATDTESL